MLHRAPKTSGRWRNRKEKHEHRLSTGQQSVQGFSSNYLTGLWVQIQQASKNAGGPKQQRCSVHLYKQCFAVLMLAGELVKLFTELGQGHNVSVTVKHVQKNWMRDKGWVEATGLVPETLKTFKVAGTSWLVSTQPFCIKINWATEKLLLAQPSTWKLVGKFDIIGW